MRHIKQLYILPPKQFDRSLIVILVAIGGAGAIYNYIGSVWTCAPRADDRNRRSGRERMLDMRDPERCELIRACAALLLARADARVTLRASAKGLTALN
jgi:hypothetical protein